MCVYGTLLWLITLAVVRTKMS